MSWLLIILSRIKSFRRSHPGLFSTIIVLIIFIFLVGLTNFIIDRYNYYQTNKKLQQVDNQIINSQTSTAVSESKVNSASSEIKNTKIKVAEINSKIKEIRKQNKSSVKFEEVNKKRCEVYPEDLECQ